MFSERIALLRPSPIREMLAVTERPGVVSFAGGLPAAEMLPEFELSTLRSAATHHTATVGRSEAGSGRSSEWGRQALQYGPSEGDADLRAVVSAKLRELEVDAPPERVMILSGSQQGIDLVAKLFVDMGTPVAVESPTYLAALQVFRSFGACFVPLPTVTTSVASAGASEADAGRHRAGAPEARVAYVVPTFANPTGACMDNAERDALARSVAARGTVLFEDDPYRDLAYDPCDRTPIAARFAGGGGQWIYQGSFSKTFAPGLRLGFLAASPELFRRLVMLKQAVDLHSSRLSQRIVFDALTSPGWGRRIDDLVAFYRARRDAFADALDRRFAGLAAWSVPSGGLFFWLTLRSPLDTRTLLDAAVERGVAFMPGEEFFAGEPTLGTMRLNFSHAAPDLADRALAILADLVAAATP
jgi:DNA-binding transcriptional MocR family regulator